MVTEEKTRRNSSSDYKRIRILNYLFQNRPEYYNKYTLCNLRSLTGTNYRDGNKILKDLMHDDLVELKKEPKSKAFKITQKGEEFMEDFRKIRHIDKIVSIELAALVTIILIVRPSKRLEWHQ